MRQIRHRKFGDDLSHRRASVRELRICSCGCCMAPMTDRPGTAAAPNHSVFAITCAKLVATDDDFARKYSEVINS